MGALTACLVPHPIGGQQLDEVRAKAECALDAVMHAATTPAEELIQEHRAECSLADRTGHGTPLHAERVTVEASFDRINEHFHQRGWTDGLPVVPPTPELVEEMLRWTDRERYEVVVRVPPNWADGTVERLAINAVMAGCKPEYMPLVVAAMEALSRPEFNLYGVQATTHPAAPLLIFNGPLGREAGINSGAGVFGAGFRANAAIGRAIRLILLNLGGARPGQLDKATMGTPGKYTYCIAENEAASPWEPFHVEHGYPASASTVTVVPAEAPHNINDHYSVRGESVLKVLAGAIAQAGANNNWYDADIVVVLCPEHAATIARDAYSKQDVQRYLFEHARTPLWKWSPENVLGRFREKFPDRYADADEQTTLIPIVHEAESIQVIVAGGAGKHSMHIPTMGTRRSLTHPITLKSGEYASSLQDFRA